MILKTEAIALTIRPFSRTSQMVTWLTRDYGRIVTPVKGACRPKSAFLGQIDIGYRSELLFYEREISSGMHHIKETTPLNYRSGLRLSWQNAVAADYICALSSQSVETLIDAPMLYEDLDNALTALSDGGNPQDIIINYEFSLLDRLGLKPNFENCKNCASPDNKRNCRFVIPAGRLNCYNQNNFDYTKDTVALTPQMLRALRMVADGESISSNPPHIQLAVRRFLGMFLSHHLDISLYSRRAVFEWIDFTPVKNPG